jgi:hypothetical protein
MSVSEGKWLARNGDGGVFNREEEEFAGMGMGYFQWWCF